MTEDDLVRRAHKMEEMTHAILETIEQHGGYQDAHVVIVSLGVVLGSIALMADGPQAILDAGLEVSRGVVNSTLLN